MSPMRKKVRNYTGKSFRPYALAIGQLLLTWNDLHELLASIYWALNDYNDALIKTWNNAKFDRSKRDLLKYSAKIMRVTPSAEFMKQDILWLLGEINAIAESRNDVGHAPLIFLEPNDAFALFGEQGGVTPLTTFENPRALNLRPKKQLLRAFRETRDKITALRDYTAAIGESLSNEHAPWPDRPASPIHRRKNKQEAKDIRLIHTARRAILH